VDENKGIQEVCKVPVETLKKAFEATYFALLSKVVELRQSSILMPLSACPNMYCIRPADRTRNIGQQDGTTGVCISLEDTSNNISMICLEFNYIQCIKVLHKHCNGARELSYN